MGPNEDLVARELGRQLATLTLAAVPRPGPGHAALAVGCRNTLCRLGLDAPLGVVADLAALLSLPEGQAAVVTHDSRGTPDHHPDRRGAETVLRYAALLRAVAQVPAVAAVARRPLSQDLLAILIARLLGDTARPDGRTVRPPMGDLPLASLLYSATPSEHAQQHDTGWAMGFLGRLVQGREVLLARAEQLDMGPLRLLGLFSEGPAPTVVDLWRLMRTPAAGRAIEVSLQLLPSILETKRAASAQRLAIDGYASIERRGNLDALLPSELAHDDDVFDYKGVADELLYYGHERREELVLREHWILVDSSASMRGAREAFARGLGVAIGKKLHLQGDATSLRFFDSRLHRRVSLGAMNGHELPYLYCFRSDRGRNYARVFDEVLAEARRVQRRGQRALHITFITHGECHVPTATMEALSEVARVYGLFILPSRPLVQAYLPTLARYQEVTEQDLARPETQKARGLAIVADIAQNFAVRRRDSRRRKR